MKGACVVLLQDVDRVAYEDDGQPMGPVKQPGLHAPHCNTTYMLLNLASCQL